MKILFLVAALLVNNAWASEDDLVNCLSNGNSIDPYACTVLRSQNPDVYQRQIKQGTTDDAAKHQHEYDAEQAMLNKRREDYFKEEAREEAALKRKCGKDYQRLRIGIKIERLEECLGAIYETETVSAKGRVETYRTMFDWVYVKNGVVIGFTKRTD